MGRRLGPVVDLASRRKRPGAIAAVAGTEPPGRRESPDRMASAFRSGLVYHAVEDVDGHPVAARCPATEGPVLD